MDITATLTAACLLPQGDKIVIPCRSSKERNRIRVALYRAMAKFPKHLRAQVLASQEENNYDLTLTSGLYEEITPVLIKKQTGEQISLDFCDAHIPEVHAEDYIKQHFETIYPAQKEEE